MLLTITYEPEPGPDEGVGVDATVFGYLLHKHPAKVQTFSAPVGEIHVLYPEATARRCTVAVLLEVDPVGLVRNKRFRGDSGSLDHYVNDRPYVASSMLAVALGTVFRTAMTGRSDSYAELAAAPLPLRVEIPVASSRGDEENLIRRVFEPCGWAVTEHRIPLDVDPPEWGPSRYSAVTLTGRIRAGRGAASAVRAAAGARRCQALLGRRRRGRQAAARAEGLAARPPGARADHPALPAAPAFAGPHCRGPAHRADRGRDRRRGGERDRGTSQAARRRARETRSSTCCAIEGACSVVDMGCGEGALLRGWRRILGSRRIVGVDVSARSLDGGAGHAARHRRPTAERERIVLLHGSVVYRDERLAGYDAMVLMEVVEHVDPSRLAALEDAVFGRRGTTAVMVTTPTPSTTRCTHARRGSDPSRGSPVRVDQDAVPRLGRRGRRRFGYRAICASRHEDVEHGPPTQLALFVKLRIPGAARPQDAARPARPAPPGRPGQGDA